jgi:hypothetical protein
MSSWWIAVLALAIGVGLVLLVAGVAVVVAGYRERRSR